MILAVAFLLMAPAEVPQAPKLDCSIGPIERSFGGTEWIIYACSDGKSVVAVSKEGSPASPFVFILSPDGGHYHIYGEGNGSKAASDAALADLKKLGDDGIVTLGDAARTAGR